MWLAIVEEDGTKVTINLDQIAFFRESEEGKAVIWMDNGMRIKANKTYRSLLTDISSAMEGRYK